MSAMNVRGKCGSKRIIIESLQGFAEIFGHMAVVSKGRLIDRICMLDMWYRHGGRKGEGETKKEMEG